MWGDWDGVAAALICSRLKLYYLLRARRRHRAAAADASVFPSKASKHSRVSSVMFNERGDEAKGERRRDERRGREERERDNIHKCAW